LLRIHLPCMAASSVNEINKAGAPWNVGVISVLLLIGECGRYDGLAVDE